ncbi:hypothetical protein [Oceanicoccus sp. KOV_DT_Chl]|uniref:hypothetical protein n=1 Tax=Oceanicoccus sp. KOV_DT_Chl TaxID=1904639 RepID=UPI000C7B93C5|nr:hypothetical protein [Oceanicoccus sp. KOV_DT_Chl]
MITVLPDWIRQQPLLFLFTFILPCSTFANSEWPQIDANNTEFCQTVQQKISNTKVPSHNTLLTDMASFRHAKPAIDPLTIYQVVTYQQSLPVMVSCKVKSADHIREHYGANAAGEQQHCTDIAKLTIAKAISELQMTNTQAAHQAEKIQVNNIAPGVTGRSYLASFQLSYLDDAGRVYLNAPGLLTRWEDWRFYLFPNKLRGQVYCHIPTTEYIKALALGKIEPGLEVTTEDDAPTQPW